VGSLCAEPGEGKIEGLVYDGIQIHKTTAAPELL